VPSSPVYFVHISDTHFGPTRDFELYGNVSYKNAERLVETINSLPTQPDFVVHTGDVVSNPDVEAYKLAAGVFSHLNVPIYFVNGNHDTAKGIHAFLPMGKKEEFSADTSFLSYSFELKGHRFITLDARGPDEIDPHGVLRTHQFDFLRREIERDSKPFVVFVHFPPLKLDSIWLDESMLLLNGELLHQMLVTVRDKVRGVFYGHVHRGIQILKDGILYSSVASTGCQFCAWPSDKKVQFDLYHPSCFNFVTLTGSQTIIKEHTIMKP